MLPTILKKINNSLDSIVFLLPAAIFFVLSNFIIITILYLYSGNLTTEILKWLQFFALSLIILYFLKKLNRFLALAVVFIIYYLYLVLIAYFLFTETKFDFSFFARSASDMKNVLPQFTYYFLAIFFICLVNTLIVNKFILILTNKHKKLPILISAAFILLTFFSNNGRLNNELVAFARTIYKNDKIINYYQDFYGGLVQKSVADRKIIENETEKLPTDKLPPYLDNIIILHLESLNGFLVNNKNTPVLYEIASQGIFFPRFYANSVQTTLAYESMLCSLPSSFDLNLVNNQHINEIICLPNFLKKFGYKNYFLKGGIVGDKKFISAIGFDEFHNNDILEEEKLKYDWGWREDIFYKEAFQFLKKNNAEKKNLIYIETGATNHWPFKTPAGLENQVPFPKPLNHQERLTNTTYLQDKYLAIAWQNINELFPEKNYTLLILGDHSWPAEFHPKNNFNAKEAFEENFMTSMVMIIGDQYENLVINNKYSQMDILPSVIDLFGLKLPPDILRRSFLPEIQRAVTAPAAIIQIQPFNDKFINLIKDNTKYQYNSDSNKFILCNLDDDPDEKNCQTISQNPEDNLSLIKKLLLIDNTNN